MQYTVELPAILESRSAGSCRCYGRRTVRTLARMGIAGWIGFALLALLLGGAHGRLFATQPAGPAGSRAEAPKRSLPELRFVRARAALPPVAVPSELPDRSIRDISISIGLRNEKTPTDVAADRFAQEPEVLEAAGWQHDWPATEFRWTASAVGHWPLYFEDPNLERHGLSFGIVQPAVSVGRAFAQVVALPYQMTVQRPHECVYSLGRARPGDCVVYQCERFELDARAAAVEAGVLVGLFLLIP